jgi:hypothetical protein
MASRPQQTVTFTTPPAIEVLSKVVQVARTDTTAFDAFVLPKGAVIAGAYVLGTTASDAATTATVSVGSNPGTTNECVAAFSVKTNGAGYYVAGAQGGTSMGSQLTDDTMMKAKYTESGTASTTGGPWLVKVEYYYPQSGYSF